MLSTYQALELASSVWQAHTTYWQVFQMLNGIFLLYLQQHHDTVFSDLTVSYLFIAHHSTSKQVLYTCTWVYACQYQVFKRFLNDFP
jgi:hypothetical protein